VHPGLEPAVKTPFQHRRLQSPSATYLWANGDAPSPLVFAKLAVKGMLENAICVVVISRTA